MMEYKGYMATVEFDADANLLHGRVVNTRDVITFQGRSVDEIQQAFIDSVEDYLEFCATRHEEPERPFSGKLLLRMSPELHRSVTICAAELGTSVNRWMVLQLEESVARNASPAPRERRPLPRYSFEASFGRSGGQPLTSSQSLIPLSAFSRRSDDSGPSLTVQTTEYMSQHPNNMLSFACEENLNVS